MNLFMDRNRLYLILVYFSLSFFYITLILNEEQDPVPLLGYILGLIFVIVTSHDRLLRIISQATGQLNYASELQFFTAFIELNRKIHNFLDVDDVLLLVNDTLKARVQVRRTVYLLSSEIPARESATLPEGSELQLRNWRDHKAWNFHTAGFEAELLEEGGKVTSFAEAPPLLKQAFAETGTSLLVPVTQNGKVLCAILIGRSVNDKPYTSFEYQMYGYLANQLSIILDRIRIYAKILQKTAMDHAEKVQVMQSLSANIAHEMRTPLSGIRASISGLEEYLPDLLRSYDYCVRQLPAQFPPIRENHLNTLQGTPRRIKLMIDQANTVIDMLLMNLRENALDRRQLNPCSAAAIVEQAVDRYPFKSGERDKLYLDLEQNFTFLGIESLCIYILFNLLKNAFYSLQSAQKGHITIRLERGEPYNRLIFRDGGLGIPPELADKVFDGFFTTKSDGTGAGLAFCKRTVLNFDGKIEVNSVLGEYAEFVISLPVYRGAH
jgi:signal transduction histidine kinase